MPTGSLHLGCVPQLGSLDSNHSPWKELCSSRGWPSAPEKVPVLLFGPLKGPTCSYLIGSVWINVLIALLADSAACTGQCQVLRWGRHLHSVVTAQCHRWTQIKESPCRASRINTRQCRNKVSIPAPELGQSVTLGKWSSSDMLHPSGLIIILHPKTERDWQEQGWKRC